VTQNIEGTGKSNFILEMCKEATSLLFGNYMKLCPSYSRCKCCGQIFFQQDRRI